MGNRCDYPYEQIPGVPEPATADAPQHSLLCKENYATRRRRSGSTHRLHPKNSHPILRPSGGSLEAPRVGVLRVRPQHPLEVSPVTITRCGPPVLTAEHSAC
ncbi:hypothetical protein Trydic_g20490 [Trypoxylus dichotomus]